MESKGKVTKWLEDLPEEFNSNNESAYISASDSTTFKDVEEEQSKEDAKAVEEWDPMGYDFAAPLNSKPFYVGDLDDDLINKKDQRLCRFFRVKSKIKLLYSSIFNQYF